MSCEHSFFRLPASLKYRFSVPGGTFKADSQDGAYFYPHDARDMLLSKVPENLIQEIPCGVCLSCRLARSRKWAERAQLECSLYPVNYFLTLTYNQDFLPYPDREFLDFDGEVKQCSTLVRHDPVRFLKRFRENMRERFSHTGIRTIYCGEYGELRGRPHYHMILFNCPDLFNYFKFFRRDGSFTYYSCDFITDSWSDKKSGLPLGDCAISEASYDTCAYTARYILKKQLGNSRKEYDRIFAEPVEVNDDIEPLLFHQRTQPFFGCSNRPGIAAPYFATHSKEIYNQDAIFIKKKDSIYRAKPPRYFDKLYDLEDSEDLERVKQNRINSAVAKTHSALAQTTLSREELEKSDAERLERKEKRRCISGL